jgi:hypothetical protein
MTDGVLSDIVTISVLILINTYDKADPPTSNAGSIGPNVQLRILSTLLGDGFFSWRFRWSWLQCLAWDMLLS